MTFNKFYVITFFVTVLFAGCKSASVVRQEPPLSIDVPPQESPNELRGLYMSIPTADITDPGILEKNMDLILRNASVANFNMIFLPYRKYAETVNSGAYEAGKNFPDPFIEALINESHKLGLKTCFTIDLNDLLGENYLESFRAYLDQNEAPSEIISILMQEPQPDDTPDVLSNILLSNQIFPYLKSYLKDEAKGIIEMYDIDGISYDLTNWASLHDLSKNQGGNNGSSDIQVTLRDINILEIRLKDLLEDMVVETMLVKPYLLHSITYPGDQGHEFILSCLENNIVDFITPVFDLKDEGLVEDLSGLWNLSDEYDDHTHESIFPCFRNPNPADDQPVIDDLLAFNKEMGSHGFCILVNISRDMSTDKFNIAHKFPDSVILPENLKKRSPFDVAGLKVKHLVDTEIQDPLIHLYKASKVKMMDSKGNIGLVMGHPDSIDIEIADWKTVLRTNQWSVPYRYTIDRDSGAIREGAWVEFRRMPSGYTNNPSYHFLCKTKYPAAAWINNEILKVYKTGIFFKEIKLKEGSNRIRAEVLTPDSLTAFYEMEFIFKKDDKITPVLP